MKIFNQIANQLKAWAPGKDFGYGMLGAFILFGSYAGATAVEDAKEEQRAKVAAENAEQAKLRQVNCAITDMAPASAAFEYVTYWYGLKEAWYQVKGADDKTIKQSFDTMSPLDKSRMLELKEKLDPKCDFIKINHFGSNG